MTDFNSFNLPAPLMAALNRMQYTSPTPIQEQTIPLALNGRDILGSAQTGTGKTAAFGIPLVAKLLASPRGSALILLPTRELAVQVLDVLKKLLDGNRMIGTALLIGGESMPAQLAQLRQRPRLIVGTPGRINDHLTRGSLMLRDVCFLVLDETDRMLDMGFSIQLDAILKFLPPATGRQTLLFSATLPDNIVKLSSKYMNNPERISVGQSNVVAPKIEQQTLFITAEEKYPELLTQLTAREGSIIVFVKTKRGCDKLAEKLNRAGHTAEAIHGDLHQRKRDRVIQGFRAKKYRIMVATDIAARGLDIPHIEHVVNYDLPQMPEDYIHRIGRTARAGAEGSALCLIAPEDRVKWRAIERLLNPDAKQSNDRPERGERSGNRRPFKGNFGDKKPGNGGGGEFRKRRPFRSGNAPQKQAA